MTPIDGILVASLVFDLFKLDVYDPPTALISLLIVQADRAMLASAAVQWKMVLLTVYARQVGALPTTVPAFTQRKTT